MEFIAYENVNDRQEAYCELKYKSYLFEVKRRIFDRKKDSPFYFATVLRRF